MNSNKDDEIDPKTGLSPRDIRETVQRSTARAAAYLADVRSKPAVIKPLTPSQQVLRKMLQHKYDDGTLRLEDNYEAFVERSIEEEWHR
jgi:hypothetical protein